MRPYLFHIGNMGVPSFFFMLMIGALAGTFFAARVAKREGADPVAMLDFGIIGIICSVLGSRIFHIIFEAPDYYLENPIRVFYFWQGGFVSIGAYTGSLVGWLVYMWRRKLEYWRYLDIATTCVPIIIFFTRLGCLMVGCCYGKPTDFFLHLTFTDPASTAGYYHLGESLHAVQIYNMLNALVMWAVVLFVYRHRRFSGQVLAAFFLYYGVTRFFIEFLRGDADRGMWFNGAVSTGQIAMLFFFAAGVFVWVMRRKHRLGDK